MLRTQPVVSVRFPRVTRSTRKRALHRPIRAYARLMITVTLTTRSLLHKRDLRVTAGLDAPTAVPHAPAGMAAAAGQAAAIAQLEQRM